jgi:hypothetical protein
MGMSDPDLLMMRRGPIDGRKFFSRSPFQSGYFITATSVCLAALTMDIVILYQQWDRLSSFTLSMLCLVAIGVVNTLWRGYRYLGRVRDLYLDGFIANVEPGSPLDIAMGVAAGAINEMLFFSFSTMVLLLGCVLNILNHARP